MRLEQERVNPVTRLLTMGWKRLIGARTGGGHETVPTIDIEREQALQTAPLPVEATAPPDGGDAQTNVPVTVADGEVSVRDGQVRVTDPVGGGLLPVLIPGDDVILTIDGHVVTQPVSVWAGQCIEVRPRLAAKPVRGFQIRVDPDRMAAYLSLEAQGPPGYRVMDTGPAHAVHLAAEVLPGRQVNPTVAEIEQALHAAGVVMGLDRAAIIRALETPGPTTVQVAAGQPPRPGSPGQIESKVPGPHAGDPHGLAVRVRPGQPLARLIPSQMGQSGYDVSGNSLEPAPVPSFRLVAGYGAVLTRDGTEAVATIAGRPVLLQIEPGVYRAAVVPVTELPGPLTAGPMPYRFEGDVVINGDVGAGVTLQAGGWIWVHGSVQNATLEAGQGIRVERSVQWSRLVTRAARKRLSPLLHQFGQIMTDLEQMRDYAGQIINHPRYAELSRVRSFGEVMLLLAQNRFGHLRRRIEHGRQTLSDLAFLRTQVDLEALLNALEHRLYSGNLNAVDDLTQFIDGIRAATKRAVDVLGAGGLQAPVHAYALVGSEVDADGDVIVHGPGAEQTIVRAGGRMQAANLRDVRATAETAMEVGVAVASGPDTLILEVPPGGQIRVSLAVKHGQLRIGSWRHTLPPESRDVLVQSDPDGQVTVTTGRTPKQGQIVPPVMAPITR